MGSRTAGSSIRVAFAYVLGAVLAIGVAACKDDDGKSGSVVQPPSPPPATLVLQNDDVAAWIAINNSFEAVCQTHQGCWSGVLFQLGAFDEANNVFARVELYKDGKKVSPPLEAGNEFYWLNIIAVDATKKDPIDPMHAFSLYPVDLDSARCPLTLTDRCARNKKISCNQDAIKGLITYWHGPHGYELSATPGPPPPAYWPDSYAFSLMDSVRVEVRHRDMMAPVPTWITDTTFAAGEVDSIVVISDPTQPDFGAKAEPTFPFP